MTPTARTRIEFFVAGIPKSMKIAGVARFQRGGKVHMVPKRGHTEWALLVGQIAEQFGAHLLETAEGEDLDRKARDVHGEAGIRKGAAGFDITFLHPKANDEFPIAGEGVLIELVQAPPAVVSAFAQLAGQPN